MKPILLISHKNHDAYITHNITPGNYVIIDGFEFFDLGPEVVVTPIKTKSHLVRGHAITRTTLIVNEIVVTFACRRENSDRCKRLKAGMPVIFSTRPRQLYGLKWNELVITHCKIVQEEGVLSRYNS